MHGEVAKLVAEHYDKLPFGFPHNKDGYALNWFDLNGKHFGEWTDDEGKVFTALTPFFEPVSVIAERAQRDATEVEGLLTSLFHKRHVLRVGKPGKYQYRYCTWGPGTYEHTASKWDKEVFDFWESIGTQGTVDAIYGSGTPISRVVPKEKALPYHTEILPTEIVSHILSTEVKHIAMTTCVCRKKAKAGGKGCDKPMHDICLWFDDWAILEAENGEGQMIDVAQALKVVERGQKAGLVHAATYCGSPWWLCNCCNDCCDLLVPRIAGLDTACANSNFMAGGNNELCNSCKNCVDICPMGAIELTYKDEKAEVEEAKCIGCGLCVTVCAPGAMHLHSRPPEHRVVYPVNGDELLRIIAKEKGKTFWYK